MRLLPIHVSLLVLCLVGCGPKPEVCHDGQVPTPSRPLLPAELPALALAHAHNDYEHPRPLHDALEAGFHSVEADVFYDGGRFKVSHLGWGSPGTLEALYLEPLQARVDAEGSIHAPGATFTLWIDLKDRHRDLVQDLNALLAGYGMLRSSEAGPAPVRVILTGDAEAKTAFVEETPDSPVWRDSNDFSLDDPPAGEGRWRAYALKWSNYLDWNGVGELPEEDRQRLYCLATNAHEKGRVVRFYGAPDREEVWQAMLDAGVDFIHTDRLEALSTFLQGR